MKSIILFLLTFSLFVPSLSYWSTLDKDLKINLCEYNYMTPMYRNYEPSKYNSICKNIWIRIDKYNSKKLWIPYKEFIKNF